MGQQERARCAAWPSPLAGSLLAKTDLLTTDHSARDRLPGSCPLMMNTSRTLRARASARSIARMSASTSTTRSGKSIAQGHVSRQLEQVQVIVADLDAAVRRKQDGQHQGVLLGAAPPDFPDL